MIKIVLHYKKEANQLFRSLQTIQYNHFFFFFGWGTSSQSYSDYSSPSNSSSSSSYPSPYSLYQPYPSAPSFYYPSQIYSSSPDPSSSSYTSQSMTSFPSLSLLSNTFRLFRVSNMYLKYFQSLSIRLSAASRHSSVFKPFKIAIDSNFQILLSAMFNLIKDLQVVIIVFSSVSLILLLEMSSYLIFLKVGKFSREVISHSAIISTSKLTISSRTFLISGVNLPTSIPEISNSRMSLGLPNLLIVILIYVKVFDSFDDFQLFLVSPFLSPAILNMFMPQGLIQEISTYKSQFYIGKLSQALTIFIILLSYLLMIFTFLLEILE